MSANNCTGRRMPDNRMPDCRMSDNRMSDCRMQDPRRDFSNMNCANQGRNGLVSRSYDVDDINLPLGIAYVPWQRWSEVYDINKGFITGTIFPDLNKPFLGRGNC